ncbi:ABC transporter ATP-binding protein [Sporolactobacillus terrae]|uniref:ABC transporter ATP-binding protein n=1 Tax=Sporolactobacillus terrae TaxID=269673 RepID=A0A410D903_9BACL|nr:ABC transporter ATP-binding protein [Sporolactobacillus terrae]QAA22583.1 ABC transporter ATP-binding protein [Sporolactobacillus terrae]QAA25556.1 ABC transporter ATP-binding protein [Sporolactobacillus terrae]UAK17366.1 ABC transporter ATP-binding protein [Sporolactobacillus terrae]BBN98904.1 ABC transporter ATP-binding protein [Sporolactobacillus terrae]
MNILEVKHLTKEFGGLTATSDINMTVEKNAITAVIGPNGAGKTTFFNMITAVYQPTSGDILLNGKSLVGLKPHQVSQFGITRTFQNIRLFENMTVLENVLVGMHQNLKSHWIGTLLQLPHIRKIEEDARVTAYDILNYVGLENYVNENAGNLAYGAQRRLEIGRAIAAKPKVLLLDEPAAGMNPKETERLTNLIHDMRTKLDVTIILIEHDMNLVMKISDSIYVLDHGELIASGKPNEIRNNKKVIEAYLGKGAVSNG